MSEQDRKNDLIRLIAHILHTYGMQRMLEAIIAHLKTPTDLHPYETKLIKNFTKTLSDYNARYDDDK
jgi:translation elongation factor EF-G